MTTASNESLTSRAYILGIATVNPKNVIWMKDLARRYSEAMGPFSKDVERTVERICQSTGNTRKHATFEVDHEGSQTLQAQNLRKFGAPSLDVRFAMFERDAIPLAKEAADRAIQESGVEPSAITHVIAVSTCGMLSPAIHLQLIEVLKLPTSTRHFTLSFIGCHSGLVALRTAAEICLADPSHRVLVVCLELNSCQIQPVDPNDININILTAAIFADGVAALVIGARPSEAEKPIYELHRFNTRLIHHTESAITIRITQSGMRPGISKRVPEYIGQNVAEFAQEILKGTGLDFDAIKWAVHPGGKAVIDSVEKGCRLRPQQLQVTRSVYDMYANMGGSSVHFVLDEYRNQRAQVPVKSCENGWTLALAFGPGITVEGVLMRML